jgi:ComF family protein
MVPTARNTCHICGERLPETAAGPELMLGAACHQESPTYARAVAYGVYDNKLRELIHLLKYEQILSAARLLGRMLACAIQKLALDRPVVVVPVPLHASNRKQRRFNPSELIVRAALKRMPGFTATLAPNALDRVRPTEPQIGLTRRQRRENVRGAFKVAHLSTVNGAHVLVVDDVLTTGTTASECARVLRRAGAENVWIATVARTLSYNAGFNHSAVIETGKDIHAIA